ncbi:NUDIX hydrolase [Actinoallomurus purpureus]|uniref:NUDIX domain-containing protein n=1 Tax=Actinoallomurus purpureus TaxID=478114 RepID=UPI0020939E20|nr:NUDIX hydrolase [Actinoallomurus purpureus]MCO6004496.1 NUDIX hydrolase [Actinoallomurus purpureus]
MTTDSADSFARPRVAAGVLFFDEQDRVLLVVPSYKDYRDIPGGYIEHGETPTEAAAREVREELGISPPIGRLLVTDWAPNQTEGDKLLFLFDGGVLAPEYRDKIQLAPDELTAYEFHDVAQAHELTISRLARRIIHGHAARQDGSTRYLEHGEPASQAL